MGEITKIQWADHTFSAWRGCTKIDPACANCYADTQSKRNPGVLGVWGPNGTRVVASESKWREPIKWNREAEKAGERRRVFCASLADVFEDWQGEMRCSQGRILHRCRYGHMQALDAVYAHGAECVSGCNRVSRPMTMDDVRVRLFRLIDDTPWLDWLLLTKRPQNIQDMRFGFRANVWLGVSVEDQQRADERIPHLLNTPAAVRFLSCEPLLGPVDLSEWLFCDECRHDDFWGPGAVDDPLSNACGGKPWRECRCSRIDWVIVGGESGHNARRCDVAWIRSIVRQCKAAGVACFVKQLGAKSMGFSIRELPHGMKSFVDSKGGDPAEWPSDLRIREFPQT